MRADLPTTGPASWGRRAANAHPGPWRRSALAMAATMCLSTAAAPAAAATVTWDGGGPGNNWNSWDTNIGSPTFGATNWNGTHVIPANGDSLVFAGSKRLNNKNTHLSAIGNLSFAAGARAFALAGNAISIAGNITNASSQRQTIGMAVASAGGTGADLSWSGGAAGVDLLGQLTVKTNGKLSLANRFRVLNASYALDLPYYASLALLSGSTMNVRDARVGSSANVLVSGLGTSWSAAGDLSLGEFPSPEYPPGFFGVASFKLDQSAVAQASRLKLGTAELAVSRGAAMRVGAGGVFISDGPSSMHLNGGALQVNGAIDSALTPRRDSLPAGLMSLMMESGSFVAASSMRLAMRAYSVGSVLEVSGDVELAFSELLSSSHWAVGGTLKLRGQPIYSEGGSGVTHFLPPLLTIGDGSSLTLGSLLGTADQTRVGVTSGSRLEVEGEMRLPGARPFENHEVHVLGGVLRTGSAQLSGDVRISGNQSTWSNTGALVFEPGFVGSLGLDQGARMTSGSLAMPSGYSLSMADSTLQVGQLTVAALQWMGSSVTITGQSATRLGSHLPAHLTLAAGNTLDVTHSLVVDRDAVLTLAGGALTVGNLSVENGGRIEAAPGAMLDMNGIGRLGGTGTVQAAIAGGVGKRIEASGRTIGEVLRLGDAASTSGFAFGGTLAVGTAWVILDDANRAQLGTLTTLGTGAQLAAANGVELGAGDVLRADGTASVLAAVRNNGQVQGTGGLLSLLGDVDGEGGFSGRLRFAAGFNPGVGALVLNFGGGDVAFGDSTVVALQILGTGVHDRLAQVGTLALDGTLRLVLGASFAPQAGQRFDLMDWAVLQGRFDTLDWRAAPLGAGLQWDASQLYTDGSLGVVAAPVPEPATMLLWLAGLAALGRLAAGRRSGTDFAMADD